MRVTQKEAEIYRKLTAGKITVEEANLATKTEEQWQIEVINLAHLLGWTVAHFRAAQTGRRDKYGRPIYVTPVQADGKGYPDLDLVRDREIHVELKAEDGVLSKEQKFWRDKILAAGGEWYCWKPRDRAEVERILRRRDQPRERGRGEHDRDQP